MASSIELKFISAPSDGVGPALLLTIPRGRTATPAQVSSRICDVVTVTLVALVHNVGEQGAAVGWRPPKPQRLGAAPRYRCPLAPKGPSTSMLNLQLPGTCHCNGSVLTVPHKCAGGLRAAGAGAPLPAGTGAARAAADQPGPGRPGRAGRAAAAAAAGRTCGAAGGGAGRWVGGWVGGWVGPAAHGHVREQCTGRAGAAACLPLASALSNAVCPEPPSRTCRLATLPRYFLTASTLRLHCVYTAPRTAPTLLPTRLPHVCPGTTLPAQACTTWCRAWRPSCAALTPRSRSAR